MKRFKRHNFTRRYYVVCAQVKIRCNPFFGLELIPTACVHYSTRGGFMLVVARGRKKWAFFWSKFGLFRRFVGMKPLREPCERLRSAL